MAARSRSTMTDVALIAVFAGLLAALTLAPAVPVGPLGVPITLQTLGVALCAMVLGPWRGAAAVGLYLLLGFAGLPIFAQGNGGLGVLARPSVGYLFAFPLAALLTGALARLVLRRTWASGRRWLGLVGSGLAGSLVFIHPLGITGMHLVGGLPWEAAVAAGVPYLPGDLVKTVVAAGIAVAVHRAFPDLTAPRVGSVTTTPERVGTR
ncbi:biotin transporter BioY [Propioniciclava soli]|uniref:Biotin transporter n=1 Tax=Propioniciclava soli TaxID=2775081 RepID=A0ABZ3CB08_9ACTN|nr:biotin transporter BioY [Propioniciclava soli]